MSLIISSSCFAQNYLLKNERNLYSFKCLDRNVVSLAIDSNNEYLVYRLVSNDTIRMEYPKNKKSCWKKMKFSNLESSDQIFKGAKNLSYISFWDKGRKYIIFRAYSSTDNTFRLDVKVVDLKLGKIINYIGILETEEGSLDVFNNSNLLEKDDRLYPK